MAAKHESHGAAQGNPQGLGGPPAVACAPVISNNGDQALGKTVDGHIQEVLQFVIDAKEVHCRDREARQNLIHPEHHEAARSLGSRPVKCL